MKKGYHFKVDDIISIDYFNFQHQVVNYFGICSSVEELDPEEHLPIIKISFLTAEDNTYLNINLEYMDCFFKYRGTYFKLLKVTVNDNVIYEKG